MRVLWRWGVVPRGCCDCGLCVVHYQQAAIIGLVCDVLDLTDTIPPDSVLSSRRFMLYASCTYGSPCMAAMGLVDLSAGVAPHAQVLVQRMGLRSADDILKLQWNGLEVCATATPHTSLALLAVVAYAQVSERRASRSAYPV